MENGLVGLVGDDAFADGGGGIGVAEETQTFQRKVQGYAHTCGGDHVAVTDYLFLGDGRTRKGILEAGVADGFFAGEQS
jgi:hypothetical protein